MPAEERIVRPMCFSAGALSFGSGLWRRSIERFGRLHLSALGHMAVVAVAAAQYDPVKPKGNNENETNSFTRDRNDLRKLRAPHREGTTSLTARI